MKKIISLTVIICFLMGCASTNPPQAPKASGQWENVITYPSDLINL